MGLVACFEHFYDSTRGRAGCAIGPIRLGVLAKGNGNGSAARLRARAAPLLPRQSPSLGEIRSNHALGEIRSNHATAPLDKSCRGRRDRLVTVGAFRKVTK
jgi:hypothetical protein